VRVLHVARQYAPSVGGIQTMVAGLARAQVERGHQVTVATLRRSQADGRALGPAREVAGGVAVRRLRHAGPRQYAAAPGVAALLHGQDVVHVHSMDFFCDFLAALSPWHRVPMLLTSHGLYFHTGDPLGLKSLYLRTVTRAALLAFREVVAVSEPDRGRLSGVARSVAVIPNGVDVGRFGWVEPRPARPTLLAIGAAEPRKRADLLVATHRLLRRRLPEARLVLTGDRRGTVEPGVEEVGVVPDAELARLLGETSLACSASEYEGFGYGVAEAMTAGVPAAVRPGHALSGAGGVLDVDFADPSRAAGELASLLAAPARLRQAGDAARRAAARFSWEHVAERYEQAYARAMR